MKEQRYAFTMSLLRVTNEGRLYAYPYTTRRSDHPWVPVFFIDCLKREGIDAVAHVWRFDDRTGDIVGFKMTYEIPEPKVKVVRTIGGGLA